MPRRSWLPENVTQYRDRHGRARYRFRKKGFREHHFHHAPGTPEFLEELLAARSDRAGIDRPQAPFTYDALIVSFYRSPKWLSMKTSSRRTYGGIIERFRKKNGGKDVRRITAAAIDAKLASMAATPAAANNLRKTLARLHRHAIKLGWRTDNPVAATDAFRAGKGFHTWTEEEIAQYEARWPLGTRERGAMALLLYTALRKSDMIMVGRQHRRENTLHLRHEKNRSETVIPIPWPLEEALAALPGRHLTYLVTEFGKPFSPAGFGNWFRTRCDLAGLPHCTAHGLRKAMSRRVAEAGATSLEGRAITGQKTDRMFAYYAEQADKTRLAASAMDKVMANLPRRTNGEPKD